MAEELNFSAPIKSCCDESIESSYDASIEAVVNLGRESESEESASGRPGVINHDLAQSESEARPLSPCDIGILVIGTLRYLNEESGSTLYGIKTYLENNSSIDVSARDKQIKKYLAEAVSSGKIVKKNRFRYALPPKQVPAKKRKRAKKTCLRPKPKKRKKVSRK